MQRCFGLEGTEMKINGHLLLERIVAGLISGILSGLLVIFFAHLLGLFH